MDNQLNKFQCVNVCGRCTHSGDVLTLPLVGLTVEILAEWESLISFFFHRLGNYWRLAQRGSVQCERQWMRTDLAPSSVDDQNWVLRPLVGSQLQNEDESGRAFVLFYQPPTTSPNFAVCRFECVCELLFFFLGRSLFEGTKVRYLLPSHFHSHITCLLPSAITHSDNYCLPGTQQQQPLS